MSCPVVHAAIALLLAVSGLGCSIRPDRVVTLSESLLNECCDGAVAPVQFDDVQFSVDLSNLGAWDGRGESVKFSFGEVVGPLEVELESMLSRPSGSHDNAITYPGALHIRSTVCEPMTGSVNLIVKFYVDQKETSSQSIPIHVSLTSCLPPPPPPPPPPASAQLIVFSNTPPIGAAEPDAEIYVMDAEGGAPIPLTVNGEQDLDPSWSHDREMIAYISSQQGEEDFDLMLMNKDGGDQGSLGYEEGKSYDDPAWSPTELKIAVSFGPSLSGDVVTEMADIWIVDVTGRKVQLTTGGHGDLSPTWSPEGDRVAFSRNGAILWKKADDDASVEPRKFLAYDTFDFLHAPDWGSAGLVFQGYLVQAPGKIRLDRAAETGADLPPLTTVTLGEPYPSDLVPSWSPEFDRVVFVRQEGVRRLRIILADGTGDMEQPDQPEGDNDDPDWGFPPPPPPPP